MSEIRPSSIHFDIGRLASPGIAISTPVNQSDGFSSPHNSANTPPGVLTKIETRMYKNSTQSLYSPFKCVCINCIKEKENTLCKKCSITKLSFLSKKEALVRKIQEKLRLSEQIDAVAKETNSLATESNLILGRIEILRQRIKEKQYLLEEKKRENKRKEKSTNKARSASEKIEGTMLKLNKAESHFMRKRDIKKENLLSKQKDLFKLRQELSLILSGIFPVSEVIAEAAPLPSRPSSNWAIVNRTEPIIGHIFKIRDIPSPDDTMLVKLATALSESPLELPTEFRPPFAAILLTVQLVTLLAFIMDCRLPYSICLREMTLRDKWTKDRLDEEWFRLCKCILNLGLRIGLLHEKLHFNCPHSNLIEIGRHILDGKIEERLQPLGIDVNHREQTSTGGLSEREFPDWDIIDKIDY